MFFFGLMASIVLFGICLVLMGLIVFAVLYLVIATVGLWQSWRSRQ
jgi:hypothetical protein